MQLAPQVFAECKGTCYSPYMKTQRSGHTDHIDMIRTTSEVKGHKDPCMANVATDGSYESCGEPLKKRNNGSTYCTIHGPMH